MQPSPRFHWLSLATVLLSGLGFLLFAGAGAVLLLMGLTGILGGRASAAVSLPYFSLMWICGLVCILLAPSIVLGVMRLLGKSMPGRHGNGGVHKSPFCGVWAAWLVMLAWLLVIAAGAAVSRTGFLDWLLLPPLQLLAVGLPLWWLVKLGRHGLPEVGIQRTWGILSAGLLVSPTLATLVELVVIVLAFVVVGGILSSQPGAAQQVTLLVQRLANAGTDPEVLMRILRPVVLNPVVLTCAVLLTSGLVPLIEEVIKPLGLWAFSGLKTNGTNRSLTPAQGFQAGLISGAAFALLESLGSIANPPGQEWLVLVLGRTGTGLLHTVTTGLMGWGLASAWQNGRFLQLAGIYLLAVFLHGLWNVFGILMALPAFLGTAPVSGLAALFLRLGQIAPLALGVLSVLLFLILLGSNHRLRVESGKIGASPQTESSGSVGQSQ